MTDPVVVSFRFPSGEYHATPWDRAANEGAVEWPPSPWRILRALLATWHTRCSDIPAELISELMSALAQQSPRYALPISSRSHTVHYMPGVAHHSGSASNTEKTYDARLQLDPKGELLVQWPELTLDAEHRAVLQRLVESLSYLGRAESLCDATLRTLSESDMERSWSVPDDAGETRVLTPQPDVTVAQLEVAPSSRALTRMLLPPGGGMVPYRLRELPHPVTASRSPSESRITAIRWALGGNVPFRGTKGVLATSGLRSVALVSTRGSDTRRRAGLSPDEVTLMKGPDRDSASPDHQHRHAHWIWLSDDQHHITDLVLWIPDGVPQEMVSRLAGLRQLANYPFRLHGYVSAPLHLQSMGKLEMVAPELVAGATGRGRQGSSRWASRTPFVLERNFKVKRNEDREGTRERFERFLADYVTRELSFRWVGQGSAPSVVRLSVLASPVEDPVRDYRTYRVNENMGHRRKACQMNFELDRPWAGPMSIGGLSHFGFGSFVAEAS